MNFDADSRAILIVRHGSHAYGLNVPTSDLDIKGVCIEPLEYHFGFLNHFEQHEHMGSKSDGIDKVIYSLKKFAKLASDSNPNIIEILHVDESDVLKIDTFGEELRAIKDDFLSKKAKFTFSGYAHSQLGRIKTHRSWLLNPPKAPPTRSEFGLSETSKVSKSELGAFDAVTAQGMEVEISKEILTVFTREKQYQAAKTHFDQYTNWVKTRNPARAELEANHGFDTKHGMHLLRLMRMCKEIMTLGRVIVKRLDDREELLDVRFGKRSYDSLIEEAEKLEAECEELYVTSTLRKEPDRVKLNDAIVSITERYLSKHG